MVAAGIRSGSIKAFMFRLSRTFEGVRLTALHFRLERRPYFHYS
jgi:hypothetical protein